MSSGTTWASTNTDCPRRFRRPRTGSHRGSTGRTTRKISEQRPAPGSRRKSFRRAGVLMSWGRWRSVTGTLHTSCVPLPCPREPRVAWGGDGPEQGDAGADLECGAAADASKGGHRPTQAVARGGLRIGTGGHETDLGRRPVVESPVAQEDCSVKRARALRNRAPVRSRRGQGSAQARAITRPCESHPRGVQRLPQARGHRRRGSLRSKSRGRDGCDGGGVVPFSPGARPHADRTAHVMARVGRQALAVGPRSEVAGR